MELRERFLSKGIDCDNLDAEIVHILDLLNFKFNIKTKYSCSGHGDKDSFYIMFHECNDFNVIEEFAEKVVGQISSIKVHFEYYVRSVPSKNKIQHMVMKNWILRSNGEKTQKQRQEILQELTQILNGMSYI